MDSPTNTFFSIGDHINTPWFSATSADNKNPTPPFFLNVHWHQICGCMFSTRFQERSQSAIEITVYRKVYCWDPKFLMEPYKSSYNSCYNTALVTCPIISLSLVSPDNVKCMTKFKELISGQHRSSDVENTKSLQPRQEKAKLRAITNVWQGKPARNLNPSLFTRMTRESFVHGRPVKDDYLHSGN